ncbi:metal-dependent hydrolase [Halorarum halobium]|uniref:metal-dependent hydrolase n=1 Tax=Halorarum halobium TaxID=3075121 RepID=UPI0028AC77BF|nr:metal-dependent hydrolase [Halobaculum sp. XH14]
MWPWEHLAVGYLLYSGYTRLRGQGAPATLPVIALVLATQMPDIIDKPLAWMWGVLPAGRSLGHSLLFATPATVFVGITGLLARVPRITPAFALGYFSHLAGDVAYPLVVAEDLRIGFLFWPLVPAGDAEAPEALPHLQELVMDFLAFLLTPRGTLYLLFEGTLVLVTVLVWIWDGFPGVRPVIDAVTRTPNPDRR